mmetsp:Transcript_1329/g.3413  ORF Transcript_1329/g.3413 Transcript_1329/m.3413 type:complete len:103 (-) Transcript_1329:818-1126(-)
MFAMHVADDAIEPTAHSHTKDIKSMWFTKRNIPIRSRAQLTHASLPSSQQKQRHTRRACNPRLDAKRTYTSLGMQPGMQPRTLRTDENIAVNGLTAFCCGWA